MIDHPYALCSALLSSLADICVLIFIYTHPSIQAEIEEGGDDDEALEFITVGGSSYPLRPLFHLMIMIMILNSSHSCRFAGERRIQREEEADVHIG